MHRQAGLGTRTEGRRATPREAAKPAKRLRIEGGALESHRWDLKDVDRSKPDEVAGNYID